MFELLRVFILVTYLLFFYSSPLLEEIEHAPSATTANMFLSISRQMSRPYLWIREKATKVYLPLRPQDENHTSLIIKELMVRGFWANTLIMAMPYAIITGQLAIISRYISYTLRKTPYHHLSGDGTVPEKKGSFTLMNLNICFLPGELPLFFGGVAPPAERVEGIVDLVKKNDPDVVCFYEAHEVDSTYSLYEKLKNTYRTFYVDIGPEHFELNSGLFVASKYDIKDANFKPFMYKDMQNQINKGYFEFKLVKNGDIIAHIFTTHLQPYRRNVDQTTREQELKEIVDDIKNEYKTKPDYPIILVGDMNITWGSDEYQQSSLLDGFFNDYTDSVDVVDESTRTYSEILTDMKWNRVDKTLLTPGGDSKYFEIIDYALIYQKDDNVGFKTKRIETFALDAPEEALSDHHGLISTVTF